MVKRTYCITIASSFHFRNKKIERERERERCERWLFIIMISFLFCSFDIWYIISGLGSPVWGNHEDDSHFKKKHCECLSFLSYQQNSTNHYNSARRYGVRRIKKHFAIVLGDCWIAGLLWVCYGSYLWLSVKNVIFNFVAFGKKWKCIHTNYRLWQLINNNKEFTQKNVNLWDFKYAERVLLNIEQS